MERTPTTLDTHELTDELCPYSITELWATLRRPGRLVSLLLVDRDRLGLTIAREHRLPALALLLIAGTALLALPLGAVFAPTRPFRVAVLLLGSLAICLPSLQIFSAYLGARLRPAQTLSLALTMTAVAALFTFAFAPIAWFLDLTMRGAPLVTSRAMTLVLLGASIIFGLRHLVRLLRTDGNLRALGLPAAPVLLAWQALFAFICFRMAGLLQLL